MPVGASTNDVSIWYLWCFSSAIERFSLSLVEDFGSLFEKRDFKERQRTSGTKSTLSLRLEQCPQQLNNPFNEYSKFDGKVATPTGLPGPGPGPGP